LWAAVKALYWCFAYHSFILPLHFIIAPICAACLLCANAQPWRFAGNLKHLFARSRAIYFQADNVTRTCVFVFKVRRSSLNQVLNAEAYLLFYKRGVVSSTSSGATLRSGKLICVCVCVCVFIFSLLHDTLLVFAVQQRFVNFATFCVFFCDCVHNYICKSECKTTHVDYD
jgi:hypothetical protein